MEFLEGARQARPGFWGEIQELVGFHGLVRNLVARDLKVRYRRSALGFLWTMLNPFLSMMIFVVIFSNLFNFPQDYALYVVCGIVFWNFFSQGSAQGLVSIVAYGEFLKKIYVPPIVFPVAGLTAQGVNLLLALIPLLGFNIYSHHFGPALFFLPIAVLLFYLFTTGLILILSVLNVFFRDVRHIYESLLLMWFYLTPIFYPIDVVPERFQPLMKLNPLFHFMELVRAPIYRGRWPELDAILISTIWALAMLMTGWVVFHRYRRTFVQYV